MYFFHSATSARDFLALEAGASSFVGGVASVDGQTQLENAGAVAARL
jgi:hypothetical protein